MCRHIKAILNFPVDVTRKQGGDMNAFKLCVSLVYCMQYWFLCNSQDNASFVVITVIWFDLFMTVLLSKLYSINELERIWKEMVMMWASYCPIFISAPIKIWPKHVPSTNLERYHQNNLLSAVVDIEMIFNISATFFLVL